MTRELHGCNLRTKCAPVRPERRAFCVPEAATNDALRRLTRDAPPPSGEIDWYFRNRRDSPCCMWLPASKPPPVEICDKGHDLTGEHARTPMGNCRACRNAELMRGKAA